MSVSRNGTADNPDTVRDQLRNTLRELRLQEAKLRLRQIQNTSRLLESVTATEQWVSIVSDRLDDLRRDPTVIATTLYDRHQGRNYPLFQTELDLSLFRQQARIEAGVNPYVQGMFRGLTSYIIGPGYTYRTASCERDNPAPKPLLRAIQQIIDGFMEHNQWAGGEQPGIEEECCQRRLIDGEWLLCHTARNGMAEVRFAEPEQLTAPPGGDLREWLFGIRTPEHDTQTHLEYNIAYGVKADEHVIYSAEQITHARSNVPRSVKRGMPYLVYDILHSFQLANRLRRNMTEGAAIQSAIAMIRQHANKTLAQATSFAAGRATSTENSPITGKVQNVRRYEPGTELDIDKGQEYVPPPAYQQGNQFVEVLHACLRAAGSPWNAPEWMATASGSDMAAYTASLTAENPFVRSCELAQKDNRFLFLRSIWYAIKTRIDYEGGYLSVYAEKEDGSTGEERYTLQQIKALVEVQCEPPSLVVRDKLEQAQVLQIEKQNGITSVQTWQQIVGRDGEQEKANIQEWNDEMGVEGLPLPLPATMTVRSKDEGQSLPGEEQIFNDVNTDTSEPAEPSPQPAQGLSSEPENPDQSEAASSNNLRATVGGSTAIAALQKAFYAGELPRNAAMANAIVVFGFTDTEAGRLFPNEAPQKLAPDDAEAPTQESLRSHLTDMVERYSPADLAAILKTSTRLLEGQPEKLKAVVKHFERGPDGLIISTRIEEVNRD